MHTMVGWTTGLTHLVSVPLAGIPKSKISSASNLTGTKNSNGYNLQLSAEPIFVSFEAPSPGLLADLGDPAPFDSGWHRVAGSRGLFFGR